MSLDQEKLNKFRSQKERLGVMLAEASEVVTDLNMTTVSRNLEELGKKVDSETFKIQVVGSFKNGKSTFINALLAESALPAYALPCTAVINEVKYGENKEAILHFRNPLPAVLPSTVSSKAMAHMQAHGMKDVPPLRIDYGEIEDYVVIPMGENPNEMLLESPYEKVELFWPMEMLKEGVEIIDSPGLNEAEIRTRVTTDYLSKADAILFVLAADRLCGQDEMNFVENNLSAFGFTDPFFIVNRIDTIKDNEIDMVQEFAEIKLSGYSTNPIFYLSAQQALDGEINNNPTLYEKSKMGAFTTKLSDFLTNEKGKSKLSQPTRELKRVINNEALYKVIPYQRAMLGGSLNDVRNRYMIAKPKLDTLKQKKEQIMGKLRLRIEQSNREFERALFHMTLSVSDMIAGWINDYEPKSSLGIVPTKKKITAVVLEISEHVAEMTAKYQTTWRNEIMIPLVNDKAAYVFESMEHDFSKLYDEIDAIALQVSGAEAIEQDPVPLWQRIAGAAGGLLLGFPDIAVAAGMNGISKELIKNVGIVIGTEMLLALIGLSNPLILLGGIIAAILGGGLTGKSAMDKLKQELTKGIVNSLCKNASDNSKETADSITSHFYDFAKDISDATDNEIQQAAQQVDSIMEEMEKGQAAIDDRKKVLDACEERLTTLNSKLDELMFELIEH